MFSAWLKGPVDDSLEGRKKRLIEMPDIGGDPIPNPEATPRQALTSPNSPNMMRVNPETKRGEDNAAKLQRLKLSQKRDPGEVNWHAVGQAIRGRGQAAQRARGLLDNDRVRAHVQNMMNAKTKRQEGIGNAIRSASNIDEAMLMLESQGYVIGNDGKLKFSPSNDLATTLADNAKPAGIPNARQFSGWDWDQKEALQGNPELLEALANNDLEAMQRLSLRNKFLDDQGKDGSWEIASEIYNNRMARGLQRNLQNFGTPLPAPRDGRSAFNPLVPVRYHMDEEGNYTGGNNIDDLWKSGDPQQLEEYLTNFGTQPTDARAISILQKILLSGGMDVLTGRDENITPGNGTIDHLFGRSNPNPAGFEPMMKESPLNMGMTMGNTNQFKVRTGDDPADLAGYDFDGVNSPEEWIAKRLESDVWQKILDTEDRAQMASAADVEGGSGQNGIPALADFLNLDDQRLKDFISDYSNSRPHGLDIRNLGKLAPEPRIKNGQERESVGWLDNTWSGGRGFGNDARLNPLRAGLAGALLNSSQLTDAENQYFESQGITKDEDGTLIGPNGRPLSASAARRAFTDARAAKRQFVGDKYTNDIRGLSTIYGLGKMSNDEYIDHHRRATGNVLDLIDNPEIRQQFSGVADTAMNQWLGRLNEWFDTERAGKDGLFPLIRSEGALRDGAKSATPTAIRALMRSERAKDYLTQEEKRMLADEGF